MAGNWTLTRAAWVAKELRFFVYSIPYAKLFKFLAGWGFPLCLSVVPGFVCRLVSLMVLDFQVYWRTGFGLFKNQYDPVVESTGV